MAVNSTLDNASVLEEQLAIKTSFTNSSINGDYFKLYYANKEPSLNNYDRLSKSDLLYDETTQIIWVNKPVRKDYFKINGSIDTVGFTVSEPYICAGDGSLLIETTGETITFKVYGDEMIIPFTFPPSTTENYSPQYFEIEYLDIGNPNGWEQNKQYFNNIDVFYRSRLAVINNDEYTFLDSLYNILNSDDSVELRNDNIGINKDDIAQIILFVREDLPGFLQDKSFKIKNLKFVANQKSTDWIPITQPKFYETYEFGDPAIIPYPANYEIFYQTNELPYTGYYQVDFFCQLEDWDIGTNTRKSTYNSQSLYVNQDGISNSWKTIDVGPNYVNIATPDSGFYNNSLQGSRIVRSCQFNSKEVIRFKIMTSQPAANGYKIPYGYWSIEYLGE